MILLFTDYGTRDAYSGLIKAAILECKPGAVIVDLLHHAPKFNIKASAHLLAAMAPGFQIGSVCAAVIDPGVGSDQDGVVMLADDRWYVGPDNGLLSIVAGQAAKVEYWRIDWRAENTSISFHGRDLYAPIAALIEAGIFPHGKLSDIARLRVNFDCGNLYEVIYVDHYGNVLSGVRAAGLSRKAKFSVGGRVIKYAPVFSAVSTGQLFWFVDSFGLVEFAENAGSAAQALAVKVGDLIEISIAA